MAEPDLSEFLSLSKPRRLECGVASVLASLSESEAEQLRAACAKTGEITHSAIAGWLSARGHKLRFETIGRHRRKQCSCG